MAKNTQVEYDYTLLMEGKMDMMFLPAGAVAWLWKFERPEAQSQAAALAASAATRAGNPVVDAALLRADQNVLVLHLESGESVNVYPDGGYGSGGYVVDQIELFVQGTVYGDMGPMGDDPMDPTVMDDPEETVELPDQL